MRFNVSQTEPKSERHMCLPSEPENENAVAHTREFYHFREKREKRFSYLSDELSRYKVINFRTKYTIGKIEQFNIQMNLDVFYDGFN
jgi:hypothetical protein